MKPLRQSFKDPFQTPGGYRSGRAVRAAAKHLSAAGRMTVMGLRLVFSLCAACGALHEAARAADQTAVRLGTILPGGTSQHQVVLEMAEKWRKASSGQVKVTIFPNGQLGDEADMVRKIRIGQLNAGLFSVVGLAEIDSAVSGLQYMPLTFRSWEEVDYIRENMRSLFEKRMEEKGFVVLFWADMGWVRFFSKEPRTLPEHFKKAKLFSWAGNVHQVEIMKAMGYRPVPLETTDILTGLNTRMIDALPVPPLLALAGQFNGPAPHMLDLKWAPIVGAAVMKKEVWQKFSKEWHAPFREAADEAGRKIRARGRLEDAECIQTMQSRGLKVHAATPEIEEQWRQMVEQVYPKIRGGMVPADIFDKVHHHLKEYRACKSTPKP